MALSSAILIGQRLRGLIQASGDERNATSHFAPGCGFYLIQARENAAAEDVGGFGSDLGNEVAQLTDIGHVLLVGSLRHIDLPDQRCLDRGAGWIEGQKILELRDRLPGNLVLALDNGLQALGDRLVGGDQRLDIAALDVQKRSSVEARNLEGLGK